ncbi:ABC-2 type transport system ATP-binding protein [Kineothrix alysoides]|uniref:ABC-2 type transport system ATP-binding protein n=1 Tax=Kineothrix alysoides TaxID=1469948 RepID=A0A4R1R578_9FIRM|nr:ABC transporter ATP-binding protein [Kineothrix alysoides]TCL60639.1 ABC-2 type transport system ATP-binding protein [Kineothrix alysoides]
MEFLAEIRGVTKSYGRTVAVNNMNLMIPRGKIIGLLGPNGSGKSTLIKMMNGLLTPTAGSITINGFAPGIQTKARVAYLPEKTYLQDGMRVCDIVDYFCDFYEDFNRNTAFTMLQSLGISFEARLKTLSKGTKEKVQLILVMSRNADLYILDEPIAGVDPAARDYILKTIISNYSENASILLSTHLISDIENILDEVIFIREGQVLSHLPVDQIREQYGRSIDSYFREVFAC